jgi:hypothetical protein
MAKPKTSQLIERKRLLEEFGWVCERDIAIALGVDLKTLRNRPAAKKPRMRKVGRENVSTPEWIRDYLEGAS